MHALTAASPATFAVYGSGFLRRRPFSSSVRLRIARTVASFALACGLALDASIAQAGVAGWETAASSQTVSEDAPSPLAQRQVRWLLARFITQARSVPADAYVLSRDFLDAYHYAVGDAAVALNAYVRDEQPYARMLAHERSEVDVSSIAGDGENRFEIAWTETRYAGGTLVAVEYWHASLEIGAANEAAAGTNPFDVYVRDVVWSRYD